jgi:DNA invertase Pin-like site-specific DNA recombinase
MQNNFAGKKVAIYARVSTKRQSDNAISVPDQIAYAERWIAEQGAIFTKSYVDAKSAKNDERPQFKVMMSDAMNAGSDIDVILVHSLSRLFRNALDFMQYKAQLQRHKVRIISITQSFGDDPASELAVGMLALFDEYHSAENSKHVRRTMLENAVRETGMAKRLHSASRPLPSLSPKGKIANSLSMIPLRQTSFASSSRPTSKVMSADRWASPGSPRS